MNDCGFCHHPATVHYTRCAVDAGKSTQCRCSQPDFAHEQQGATMKYADDTEGRIRRIKDQDATIAALVEALEALMEYWDQGTPVRAGALVVSDARIAIRKAKVGAR